MNPLQIIFICVAMNAAMAIATNLGQVQGEITAENIITGSGLENSTGTMQEKMEQTKDQESLFSRIAGAVDTAWEGLMNGVGFISRYVSIMSGNMAKTAELGTGNIGILADAIAGWIFAIINVTMIYELIMMLRGQR